MSTQRCDHGNVISDTVGDYRCYLCEPVNEDDLAERDKRIEELERVVEEFEAYIIELCERAAVAFRPPPREGE